MSVALVVQHAKRVYRIVIRGLSDCTIFFYINSKRHDFWKDKVLEHKSVLIFSTNFAYDISYLRRTERCMIKSVHRSSCKVPVILVTIEWHMNFLNTPSKNTQVPNFMKMHPVGAELLHADGWIDAQTDMTKVIIAFCNFVSAPKNQLYNAVCRYATVNFS
jgi:hypothetical protein